MIPCQVTDTATDTMRLLIEFLYTGEVQESLEKLGGQQVILGYLWYNKRELKGYPQHSILFIATLISSRSLVVGRLVGRSFGQLRA